MNNAKLSISADSSRVWSALLKDGVADSISYSDDQGSTWITMDTVLTPNDDDPDGLNPRVKPGAQGAIHFALLADPRDKNTIYVAGDRQNDPLGIEENFIGAAEYTGRLFRGNASIAATEEIPSPQWEHMTDVQDKGILGGGTQSRTGPHADGRDMEFRADGSILEGDDGGINIRTNPRDNTGDWYGLCGNMQNFEVHNVAYVSLIKSPFLLSPRRKSMS